MENAAIYSVSNLAGLRNLKNVHLLFDFYFLPTLQSRHFMNKNVEFSTKVVKFYIDLGHCT